MAGSLVKVSVDFRPQAIARVKAKLRAQGERAKEHTLTVGIHPEEGAATKDNYDGEGGQATVAQVAQWMEFGTDVIPERPFRRMWFDINANALKLEMTRAMRAEFGGNTGAVRELARKLEADFQEWMRTQQGHLEPLQASTVEAKQRAGLARPEQPLFATGQLAESITAHLDGEKA